MASANQEQNTTSGHSLAMQRQQQDLVKLLAQHFHHQFYQLALGNGSSQLSGTATSQNATTTTNIAANPRLPTLSTFQTAVAHYGANEMQALSSRGSGGFDLDGMNLVANANNQMVHNHILRSQATNTGHLNSLVAAAGSAAPPESLIDFSILNNLNPYPWNDMNLFHALGLNLTNNQLVLSLQQQQHQQNIAQSSAAIRQYESRTSELASSEQEMRQSSSRNSNETTTANNLIDPEDNHSDGKEMLKFSINTILGRGSPHSGGTTEFNSSLRTDSISKQVSAKVVSKQNSLFEQPNEFFEFKTRGNVEVGDRDERLSANDCDSNDSCSDSSLINASTPIPQARDSILFKQTIPPPPDHRDAHLNSAGPIGSGQLPRNHIQAHQRPVNHHHTLPFLPGSSAFPWTVAARGKPRRGMMRRAVFSDSQRVGLEKRFQLQKYISKPDRKKLAEKLGLRDSQVKIWFQNRRMKWRNSKERELLSAGGSREQTLPTRNNPNPDLSDVGETIKRITANNGPSNNDLAPN